MKIKLLELRETNLLKTIRVLVRDISDKDVSDLVVKNDLSRAEWLVSVRNIPNQNSRGEFNSGVTWRKPNPKTEQHRWDFNSEEALRLVPEVQATLSLLQKAKLNQPLQKRQ